jgi:predicted transcriptional regulator of viral defense system
LIRRDGRGDPARVTAVESEVVRAEPDKVDVRLAWLAAQQWSVVDVADLTACGLSADAIATRVENGRLSRVYRGVYGVIPNLTLEGQFLATVKACGPDAVLSHFSAAVLYGWFDWDGRFPEITVTNPRQHRGILTHRSAEVERTIFKGIPVAPPARVIRDLADDGRASARCTREQRCSG